MRTILYVLLLLGFSIDLYAESYIEKKSAAIKMLDIMNKNGFLDYHIKSQIKMEVASNPLLSFKETEVIRFLHDELSFEKLKPELANIYVKELSVKEMQQFGAFFDTSVGQKMIAKMPRLIGLSSNLAQQKIQAKMPELLQTLFKQ